LITLLSIFPEHLNLNGDQGNTVVLEAQLRWRGIEVQTVAAAKLADFDVKPDFILVGHGSAAAWDEIRSSFQQMVPRIAELVAEGIPLLAVSTGFQSLTSLFPDVDQLEFGERVSKFAVATIENEEILGYVNTDTNLPMFAESGPAFGTTLHGPVLAKNPELLQRLLTLIGAKASIEIPMIQVNEKADLLADLVAQVWKLEKPLAGE
jgi:CobQ-like glutamine amidotransferase family enzyme